MNLIGLDLNSTCLLAVSGPVGVPPRPLPLEGSHPDLPMALNLQGRHPEVGRPGAGLCRRLPYLTCMDFLAHLGESREWAGGRHHLDADRALALVLERLQPACSGAGGLATTVPLYLGRAQVERLTLLAAKGKVQGKPSLPTLLGSVSAPLALAQAAHGEHPWSGLAVVVDVDDHALTWAAVMAGEQQAFILGEQNLPHLNLRQWKARLLNGVSDRCVRHSRRDPRESGLAEQGIYDQLDSALEMCRQGQMVEVVIQAERWFQSLLLRPEDLQSFCAPLVRQAAEGLQALLTLVAAHKPACVLMSEAAARLPGLQAAIEARSGQQTALTVLPAITAAQAAHALACRIQRGEVPTGHLDVTISLVPGQSPAAANLPPKRVIPIWMADR